VKTSLEKFAPDLKVGAVAPALKDGTFAVIWSQNLIFLIIVT